MEHSNANERTAAMQVNMYRYRKSNIGHEKPDTDSTFRMFPFIKSSEVSKTNLGLKKSG